MCESKPWLQQRRSAPDGRWVPSVLLVDDHPMFRAGLKSILAADGKPWHVLESASVGPALDAIADGQHFDLVVYDWHLQTDGGGVRGLLALRQMAPNVPIVVLTADTDEAVAMAARALGAAAFLPKSAEGHELKDVLIGLLDLSSETRPEPADDAGPRAPQPSVRLTLRQLEVLRPMAQGLPNKRIARLLGIADATVRAHVTDILETLHASNRTEAVVKASRCGVIDAAAAVEAPRSRRPLPPDGTGLPWSGPAEGAGALRAVN